MGMVGKHFSPFMEMVVQLCLTACATHSLTDYVTASYGLWEWLASISLRLWKWLRNCVLQLVELRLTAYGNG